MHVRVRLDSGKPMSRRARTVLVANVGRLQGGVPLLPDDGELDVAIIAPRTLADWVVMAWAVIWRHRQVPMLETFRPARGDRQRSRATPRTRRHRYGPDARHRGTPGRADPLRTARLGRGAGPPLLIVHCATRTSRRLGRSSGSGPRSRPRSATAPSCTAPPPNPCRHVPWRESDQFGLTSGRRRRGCCQPSRASSVSMPWTIGSACCTHWQASPCESRCQAMRYCRASWLTR